MYPLIILFPGNWTILYRRNKKQAAEHGNQMKTVNCSRHKSEGLASEEMSSSFSLHVMEDKDTVFILSLTWLIPVTNEQMGFSISNLHLIPFFFIDWIAPTLFCDHLGPLKHQSLVTSNPSIHLTLLCKACFYYCISNWYCG